eukprot:scaffold9366_cov118-Isochrysis_galbana.AAC.5
MPFPVQLPLSAAGPPFDEKLACIRLPEVCALTAQGKPASSVPLTVAKRRGCPGAPPQPCAQRRAALPYSEIHRDQGPAFQNHRAGPGSSDDVFWVLAPAPAPRTAAAAASPGAPAEVAERRPDTGSHSLPLRWVSFPH